MQTIQVTVDSSTHTLDVPQDQRTITLTDDEEIVQWRFTGIRNDLRPEVLFDGDDPARVPNGPFTGVRIEADRVLGQGRNGQSGAFSYAVELRAVDGAVVTRSEVALEIVVEGERRDTSPVARVFKTNDDELGVEPDNLQLYTGDAAIWAFEDDLFERDDVYPDIEWTNAPGGQVDRRLGPFRSMTRRARSLVGTGNNGVVGDYRYTVFLRRKSDGSPRQSADPGLANNGDPPGSGPGTSSGGGD